VDRTKTHQVYVNEQGQKVPGVTTVLGMLGKPGLIDWAWKCGRDGLDYRKIRDKAASIGTLTHYLVECSITGENPDTTQFTQDELEKAENGLHAFFDWKKSFGRIENIGTETPVVCDGFGGTIDWVIKHNGKYIMVDFKTGKSIYKEASYQVAAYRYMWNLIHPDMQISKCFILRLDKEFGNYEVKAFKNLDKELEIFLSLLKAYNLIHNKRG